MSGFVTFLIGLVVGWLACKLLSGSKSADATPALPANATPAAAPAPVAAAPAAPASAAPVAAAPNAVATADHAGLAAQLHAAKAEVDSHANEVKRLESELDAARRNLLAAKHTASNHGSTISALRDDVKGLQRDLKAALEAAKA
ncbi:MAG: hypothetical protein AB8C46_15135 [Burkholderiaceae bacterium]